MSYTGVWLAPPVEINDVGERPATERPKAAHRVTDRQDRIGVEALRDAHRRIDLLLVCNMSCRQRRAEPERTRRQQHILHRRIDRRAGYPCRIGAVLEARYNPYRRLVVVIGQVFDGRMLSFMPHAVVYNGRRPTPAEAGC